jgi:hypothetical protein
MLSKQFGWGCLLDVLGSVDRDMHSVFGRRSHEGKRFGFRQRVDVGVHCVL